MDQTLIEQATMLTHAIGLALIDFLWQGLLVAALYGVFRHVFRRLSSGFHVVLGQLAMLGFLLLPVLGVIRYWGRLSGPTLLAADPTGDSLLGASPPFAQSPAAVEDVAMLAGHALPWLVALWLTGVIVLSARSGWDWWMLRRLCREARPLPEQWIEQVRILSLRMGLGSHVDARESPDVETPILFGWLRPVILLPVGLVLRLPREQVIPILLHELAHVRRLDYLFSLAELSVLTLLYYHPAVHWLARRLAQDRELACDAMVLEVGADRIDYAAALAQLAHEQRAQRRPKPRFALAAAAGLLLERIARIIDSPNRPTSSIIRRPSWPLLMALLAAAVATLSISSTTAPQTDWRFRLTPTLSIDLPLLALQTPIEVRQRMGGLIAMTPRSMRTAALPPPPVVTPVESSVVPLELPTAARALIQPISAAPTLVPTLKPAPAPREASLTPQPIHAPAPVYPREARLEGIEGSVSLSFRIDASGQPADIRIESSTPAGMFESSARRAMLRWRFAVSEGHDPVRRLRHGFDFRLGGTHAAGTDCVIPLGTRICQ